MATLRDFQNIISNAAADRDTEVFIAGPVDYAITEVWYDGKREKVWVEIIEIPKTPDDLRMGKITDEEAEELERKQIATDEMAAYEKY